MKHVYSIVWKQVIHLLQSNWKDGRMTMRESLWLFVAIVMVWTKYHFGLLVSMLILDALKNVNISNFNCYYQDNKKAWMTRLFFEEFVIWFNKKINGRKVLHLVDNCPPFQRF